uniref:C2 domain-containing protein n=1 Tax=Timema genevievae TaxID=629358 RepID=A0A7R9JUF0_TIMGE|nr:unnamed protein product [Timema genevievae]
MFGTLERDQGEGGEAFRGREGEKANNQLESEGAWSRDQNRPIRACFKTPPQLLTMLTEDSAVTTNGTSTCTNKEKPPVLNMSLQFLISEESGTGKLIISIKKENNGETVTGSAPAIDNWEEVTPDSAISYVDFVSVDKDMAVCGEVTDTDIVTEALNNNIQAEDIVSGDEEDNSSVVQERPIPSAAETMDHIQELRRFFESRNNIIKYHTDLCESWIPTTWSISDLPEKEYSGYLEPYLVVQVVKSTWPLHRRAGAPLFYLRTRTIRHTHNPQFHQTFVLDAAKTHIKDWCMKMTVYDQDRFANHTELCVLNLPLKDIKLLNSNPNPIELSYNLMQSEKYSRPGFEPQYPCQQQQVYCESDALDRAATEVDPYVRVIQLNGTSARAVKKKKTAYKHATESPNFNETLTFDLAPSQLETATFLVTVSNKNMEEAQHGCKKIKDVCLGKLALGRHVRRITVKEHWIVVAENPRRLPHIDTLHQQLVKDGARYEMNQDGTGLDHWHAKPKLPGYSRAQVTGLEQ